MKLLCTMAAFFLISLWSHLLVSVRLLFSPSLCLSLSLSRLIAFQFGFASSFSGFILLYVLLWLLFARAVRNVFRSVFVLLFYVVALLLAWTNTLQLYTCTVHFLNFYSLSYSTSTYTFFLFLMLIFWLLFSCVMIRFVFLDAFLSLAISI